MFAEGNFILACQSAFLRLNNASMFQNIPAKFQNLLNVPGVIFFPNALLMTVDDVRRTTFFFIPRRDYSSVIDSVLTMEFRSPPAHSWPCISCQRTAHSNFATSSAIPASTSKYFRCFFELFLPYQVVAIRLKLFF